MVLRAGAPPAVVAIAVAPWSHSGHTVVTQRYAPRSDRLASPPSGEYTGGETNRQVGEGVSG